MADPAAKPRPRGADRVRRVNAHRPAEVEVVLVGSSVPMTPAVSAAVLEMIALGRVGRA